MKACAALMLVLLALASADPTVIKRRAHVDPRDFALLAQVRFPCTVRVWRGCAIPVLCCNRCVQQ